MPAPDVLHTDPQRITSRWGSNASTLSVWSVGPACWTRVLGCKALTTPTSTHAPLQAGMRTHTNTYMHRDAPTHRDHARAGVRMHVGRLGRTYVCMHRYTETRTTRTAARGAERPAIAVALSFSFRFVHQSCFYPC